MVIHYKCPNCGDDMAFNSESGKLSCHSCGREDAIETFSEDLMTATFSGDEVREYECNNCGGVIITDADTTATTCSFCGAGVVLKDRLSGVLAPAKVIPFSISKEEAVKTFRAWCKNGRFSPQGFMTADRIKGITGMYVPFWLYDLNNKIQVHADCTKVRTYSKGDYIYTETSFFDVYRDLNLDYVKVPVDASEKMDDQLMDKLEPYDYNELKSFKTPYLAGYIAEKYNYDDDELFTRVKEKMSNFIDKYISSTISGYTTVSYRKKQINTKKVQARYVLLPVWLVAYDYENAEHMFAMNGQTGKVVGKPPVSFGKVAMWFTGIAGTTFLTLKLISLLIGGGFW